MLLSCYNTTTSTILCRQQFCGIYCVVNFGYKTLATRILLTAVYFYGFIIFYTNYKDDYDRPYELLIHGCYAVLFRLGLAHPDVVKPAFHKAQHFITVKPAFHDADTNTDIPSASSRGCRCRRRGMRA